jgi:hypothetical protein
MTKDQLQSQNWDNSPGFVGDNRDTGTGTGYAGDRLASDTGNATDTMSHDR